MTIEKIIQYILHTPHNTNRAILTSMLRDLIASYGGDPDNFGGSNPPDDPNRDVIYDGGLEV